MLLLHPRRGSDDKHSHRPRLPSPPPFDALWSYRFRAPDDLNAMRAARAALVWRANTGVRTATLLARYLAWLSRFPPSVVRALLAHAKRTRSEFNRSYTGQIADILRVATKRGVRPRDYYRGGLARYGGRDEMLRHVPFNLVRAVAIEITRRRNPRSIALTEDKHLFEQSCRSAGFPVVRTIALARDREILDAAGRPFNGPLPPHHLIIKPVNGAQGKGIECWLHQPSGHYLRAPSDLMSSDEALQRARRLSGDRRLLIQEQLTNHRTLLPLAGPVLSTTRIVTIPNEHGEIEIVDAFYKTSFDAGAVVDNYHSGGVLFPIDIADGRLLPGFRDVPYETAKITHHAQTGVALSGCKHPGWEAMATMARQLHYGFPDFVFVGWDIAFSPDGPVVVEANIPPGISSNRQGIFGGLVGTRMLNLLAFHAARWLEETEPADSRWRSQLAAAPTAPAAPRRLMGVGTTFSDP